MSDPLTLVPLIAPGLDGVRAARLDEVRARRDYLTEHLTDTEQDILETLLTEKRKTAFIAGRILAKQCLLELAGQGSALNPRDIEVLRKSDGRPYLASFSRYLSAPEISISHGGDFVMAAVSPRRIGVDVEPVSKKPFLLKDRIASPEEREIIEKSSLDEKERERHFVRLFSAKEAMAKSLGTHLFFALHHYRLRRIAPDGLALVDLSGLRESTYRVTTACYAHHVFSKSEDPEYLSSFHRA